MSRDLSKDKTYKAVMAGLMMAIIMVMTWMIKIPVPMTQGYVHLGDTAIYIAVLVLGKKYGAAAASLGSALADILGGYSYFAPWTFVVKGFMAYVVGAALESMQKKGRFREGRHTVPEIIAMIAGGFVMVAGYYIAEAIMYGSLITPLPGIPANIGQFVVGMILATILSVILYRTPAKKFFAIK